MQTLKSKINRYMQIVSWIFVSIMLLIIAYIIQEKPSILEDIEELKQIAAMVEVDEIHFFDKSGRIYAGTHPEYYDYTFDSGEQIGFFKPMLKDYSLKLVQKITPNTAEGKMMQYSAVWRKSV